MDRTALHERAKNLYSALQEAEHCARDITKLPSGRNIGFGAEYLIALLMKDLRLSLHPDDCK